MEDFDSILLPSQKVSRARRSDRLVRYARYRPAFAIGAVHDNVSIGPAPPPPAEKRRILCPATATAPDRNTGRKVA
jgi:hypothetical protein